MIQDRHRECRLDGALKLRVIEPLPDEAERFDFVAGLLSELRGSSA